MMRWQNDNLRRRQIPIWSNISKVRYHLLPIYVFINVVELRFHYRFETYLSLLISQIFEDLFPEAIRLYRYMSLPDTQVGSARPVYRPFLKRNLIYMRRSAVSWERLLLFLVLRTGTKKFRFIFGNYGLPIPFQLSIVFVLLQQSIAVGDDCMPPLCPPSVGKTGMKAKLRKHEHLMDILHAIRRRNEILKKVSIFHVLYPFFFSRNHNQTLTYCILSSLGFLFPPSGLDACDSYISYVSESKNKIIRFSSCLIFGTCPKTGRWYQEGEW